MATFLIYLFCIAAAEVTTVIIDPIWGIVFYFFILVATLLHPALQDKRRTNWLVLSLSLVPIIRIISLAMPLTGIPQIWWYPIIYLPLLVATVVLIRILGYSRSDLGLNWGNWLVQLVIGASGIVLGLIEYMILKPESLVTELTLQSILLPAFLLIITTGFVEELIFRGVLQRAAMASFNRLGIVFISLVFAILHIGFLSIIDVIFVFVIALLFGWIVKKTGSLFGVSLAHGVINTMLFVVAPFVLS